MGAFGSSNCSWCGKEMTLDDLAYLLADGVMCTDCARAGLSPYWHPDESTTREQVNAHIAYRSDNLTRLTHGFRPSDFTTEPPFVYVDWDNLLWCVAEGDKPEAELVPVLEFAIENSDLMRFDQLERGVNLNEDGRYRMQLVIRDHPWITEMYLGDGPHADSYTMRAAAQLLGKVVTYNQRHS